ncbi:MAG TPA: sigma-70 family RNA polymerase sigma factor [Chthonomonas sp.]|uniref:RNA polymerase sigma factor n=1 Tax=Chthonomonas sp. TaxID=2282153 RepID=UPI002B4B0440|nr:sigma-70 family RNA polymerase sigma factor [Chthonomonas sp.]HLI47737.1 sigma-70 family RNA polymerase sigma factor [Chthonomonas sp.]
MEDAKSSSHLRRAQQTVPSTANNEKLQFYLCLLKIGRYQASCCHVPLCEREDCAHDFAVHMLAKNLSPEQRNNKAYLFQCAHNFACNYLRSLPQHLLFVNIADVELVRCPHSEWSLSWTEQRALLEGYLQRLNPNQREIVVRRFYDQQSPTEIAKAIGSTPGAVRIQLHRALETLRTWMREDGLQLIYAPTQAQFQQHDAGGGRAPKMRKVHPMTPKMHVVTKPENGCNAAPSASVIVFEWCKSAALKRKEALLCHQCLSAHAAISASGNISYRFCLSCPVALSASMGT